MVKLSSFSDRTVDITVDVAGAALKLTVRPNVMTPALERRMVEAEGARSMDLLLGMFCDYIAAWDVTDDEGVPLRLEPDVVAELPSTILVGILESAQAELKAKGN